MLSKVNINEEELEKRVDELISLVAEAETIGKQRQRVEAFLHEHSSDSNWVDTAAAVLNALNIFQKRLRSNLEQHRHSLLAGLKAHVVSWFVGYDGLVADTREDLENLLNDIIGEAITDLYDHIPHYPASTCSEEEKVFVEMCEEILGELEDSINADVFLGKVIDGIRL